MKIYIDNRVQMDGETEIIKEVHDCQWTTKAGYDYLLHLNSQQEKVVIKLNERELVMTRFSQPKSSLRFLARDFDLASIPTPLGLQNLTTRTTSFELDRDKQVVHLTYDLLTDPDSPQALASYDLTISWG